MMNDSMMIKVYDGVLSCYKDEVVWMLMINGKGKGVPNIPKEYEYEKTILQCDGVKRT